MSSSSQASASSSQFESIFNAAMNEFKEKTGKTLLDDWLAKELQSCDSVEAVTDIIQGQAKAFDRFMNGSSKLMKWIRSSVHVLYTISAALGDGVGVVVPSSKAVFTGIGILLAAAKDVRASHDALVDLFERIQFFLKRLGVHTRISPTKDMVEILVKIMAEVISILSIATKEMQQSKTNIYFRKLLGRTDIEDALKKLDGLTQEEVRMAIAQVLQGINELKDVTKKVDEALREIKWNQIEQDVRRWFSPPDPSVNYNIAREAYQEGTAAWFFQGGIFKEWELVGSLLWVHGKPGSGKSILSSAIINHVISLRDAGHATLAYFFFDFRDKEKKQDTRNFLTSLLIQLSAHSNHCRKMVFDLYSDHGKGTQQPSISALTKCLHEMLFVVTQRPVYLIIDALDECPNISGLPTPRTVLLGLLEDLVDLCIPNLHICVTSRPEFDIKIVLEPLAYSAVSLHEESGQKKDISDYVNTVVNSDRKMRRWRDVDKVLVFKALSEKADGMFRWVYCQLEVLQHCINASIRQTLDKLPESLDETYARVLSQIPQSNQAHAHRLLQCLMVAVRPLRVEELAEVLAFEFDTAQGAIPTYRAGWQLNDQEQAVLSTCSSLIAIVGDDGSQVVQFSHFSVKEFLMSDRLTSSSLGNFSRYQINPGPAHTILAQACLGVLHWNDDDDEECVEDSPLIEYAAQHWVTHAQFEDVASCVKDGMVSLFDCDQPYFEAWLGIYNIDHVPDWDDPYWDDPPIPTPLYYSSLCGFSDLVEHLAIKYPQHINAVGGWHKLPLLAALVGEHVLVAEILLKYGANVDIGMRERTPLHEENTDVSVVRFLLDHGADVNSRQDDLRTPLHQVIRDRELEVARVLLEHKANVHSRDIEGKTPFQLMIEDGDQDGDPYADHNDDGILDLGQLLVNHGADVNIRDEDYNTPLHMAMATDTLWYERARILLKLGADPNAENDAGETPLHQLFKDWYNFKLHLDNYGDFEHDIIDNVELSLERGAEVDTPCSDKWTLLHKAAFRGWPGVVAALLDRGANVNAKTKEGETPLHMVSQGLYKPCDHPPIDHDIARLLVERGADVNAQDEDKNTPLHSAALDGRLEIVQVLLDHGASAVVENGRGESSLHLVSKKEHPRYKDGGAGIAQLLLERGVDVNALDEHQNTPLHSAALRGLLEIVKVLLDHGAIVDAENDEGSTPFNLVLRGDDYDSVAIARLLLERGADVNARKKNNTTPLYSAIKSATFYGWVEIARMLINRGAIADAKSDKGETPLNLVSRGHYYPKDGVGFARLLLERGVDVNAQNKSKITPLHSAAFRGKLEIVQVLLDYDAIADAENDEGETPLHLVSRGDDRYGKGGVAIARLLLERGVDVNAQNKSKTTPLHSAAFRGRLEIVQVLLDYGAIADAENDEGETPLHLVSRCDYYPKEDGVSIARLLLERGVDVNGAQNKNKTTSLHSAAFKGRLKIVQVLLDYGAIADAENDEGETPLHLVSRGDYSYEEGGVGIARLLLERGVDVNAQNKSKTTPLHLAAFRGRLEIVQVLLDYGAIADAENDEGKTPLHQASRGDYDSKEDGVGIVRLLLERGVDVNAQDKNKTTPLHSATFKGRLEIVQALLDYGAIAGAENNEGKTPLNLVLRKRLQSKQRWPPEVRFNIVRLLLARGVDVNSQDKYHNTPLHSAAFNHGPRIARLLLDHGANPNAENEQGETLLHEVSRIKHDSRGIGIARLLLGRGVDVHARDRDHNTALHSAAFNGRLALAQVLLDHAANPTAENDQGETPLHLLSRGKYDHGVGITRLLVEHGADVNGRKRNMWTPLHLAAVKQMFKIARELLDHGANPNAADEQGETPLHVVSQGKYDPQGVSIVRLLLARGADVNALDKDQYTPFESASYFGRFDIARLLLAHDTADAESASRGTKVEVDDEGSRSGKKPKVHEDVHPVPWRHAHFIDHNV